MVQGIAKDAPLTRERPCWLGTMTTKLTGTGFSRATFPVYFQVRVRLATRCISIRSAGSETVATFSWLWSRHGAAASQHLPACCSGLWVRGSTQTHSSLSTDQGFSSSTKCKCSPSQWTPQRLLWATAGLGAGLMSQGWGRSIMNSRGPHGSFCFYPHSAPSPASQADP